VGVYRNDWRATEVLAHVLTKASREADSPGAIVSSMSEGCILIPLIVGLHQI
jgi:hypothetical protein